MTDYNADSDSRVSDEFEEAKKQWDDFKEEYNRFLDGPEEMRFEDDSNWRAAEDRSESPTFLDATSAA